MVGVLDIHRHDVVREQQDLVGVDLAGVLALELLVGDEVALDEVRHERARAREGVQDMHAIVGKRLAELALENAVGLAKDVVDDLGRGVDDAHLVRGRLERDLEELLVEVADELLARRIRLDGGRAAAHARIHVVEDLGIRRLLDLMLFEHTKETFDGDGHGVRLRELEVPEQGVEHRDGDDVLGDHLDRVLLGDAGI